MLESCAVNGPVRVDPGTVSGLKVIARCDCGCDTVEFEGIDWSAPATVVADGQGSTGAGEEVGIIVFANGSTIACLEVYNYGDAPAHLPRVESIKAHGAQQAGAV
jgi:hypothetical protein